MGGCVSRKKDTPKVILCYGASLTAGTSPPGMLMFPYAPGVCDLINLAEARYSATQESIQLKHAFRAEISKYPGAVKQEP